MREIKFRAWDGTEMYNPILEDGKTFRSGRDYEDYNDAPFDSVMQYTGLKDKNGKEIYEGDIAVIDWRGKSKQIVEFENGIFKVGGFSLCTFTPRNIEVIGNIHENPELLRERQQALQQEGKGNEV